MANKKRRSETYHSPYGRKEEVHMMFIMIEKGIALETIYSNNGHSKFHEVWYETDDYA